MLDSLIDFARRYDHIRHVLRKLCNVGERRNGRYTDRNNRYADAFPIERGAVVAHAGARRNPAVANLDCF